MADIIINEGDRLIINGKLVIPTTGEIIVNDDGKMTINKIATSPTDAINRGFIETNSVTLTGAQTVDGKTLTNTVSINLGTDTVATPNSMTMDNSGLAMFMDDTGSGNSELYSTSQAFFGNQNGTPFFQLLSTDLTTSQLFFVNPTQSEFTTSCNFDADNPSSIQMNAGPGISFLYLTGGSGGAASISLNAGDNQYFNSGDINIGPSSIGTGSLYAFGVVSAGAGIITNADITGNRPVSPTIGQMFLDTTLNKPIWYSGSQWIDSTGAPV